jgi:S-adenosylmethionine:tRNA ribosyltransferase-isomerase
MTAATRTFSLSDFDFALPPELIAQHPAPVRSASRLLDGRAATPVDRVFRELPGLLRTGDLVVFNNTQVVKARLFGEKSTGGKVELLVERLHSHPGRPLAGRERAVVPLPVFSRTPRTDGRPRPRAAAALHHPRR